MPNSVIEQQDRKNWVAVADGLRGVFPVLRAVLVALGIGGVLIMLSGGNPLVGYRELLLGAFVGKSSIASTLQATTPLLYTALSFLIAFRAGIFNAGGDGQLMVGALAATAVGVLVHGVPPWLHIPLVMLAAMVAGAAWAFVPAIARLKYGANEIIGTIMMNFVAVYLTDYIVQNHFKGSGVIGTTAASPRLLPTAELGSIIPPYQVTIALPIALALALLCIVILKRTVFGYEVSTTGTNATVAEYAGISAFKVMLVSMLISGAVAGLGGATIIMGVQKRFITPFTTNLGMTGVIACLLGRAQPLGAVLGAFFLGALQSGGLALQYKTNISERIVLVLSALIILFVTATDLSHRYAAKSKGGAVK